MEGITTGAGLGALGFWIFVAAIVAVGVWDASRKRETHHETLRRIIESGQPLDDALVDKLLNPAGSNQDLEVELWTGGLIMLALAPALALFGYLLSVVLEAKLFGILGAVAVLIGCLGLGFLGISRIVRKRRHARDTGNSH